MLPALATRLRRLAFSHGFVLLLLGLGCSRGLLAQYQPAWSHQAWSTEEGLPDASVHGILQSRDGYVWVATEGGAARFDGTEFTVLRSTDQSAFTSDDISSLAEDSDGTVWFGTADGLVREQGGVFHHVGQEEGLAPNSRILSLASARNGALLALTSSGLFAWHGHEFRPVPLGGQRATALLAGNEGTVRIVLESGSVLSYSEEAINRLTLPGKLPSHLLGVVPGRNGSQWLYSAHEVRLETPDVHGAYVLGKEFPGARVTVVCPDREGDAWVGTNHGLLHLRGAAGGRMEKVEALGNAAILSLLQDREGNVWVGTESSGLHILRPRKFRMDPASAGEAVTAVVAEKNETAWFGTRESGLHRLGRGTTDQPVAAEALTSPVVLSLVQGRGEDVWVGTPDGLNHVTGGTVQRWTSANGLPDDFVRSVLVDRHGVVWAGTRAGLARLAAGRITTRAQAEGLASDSIGPLLEMRAAPATHATAVDDLWIGTAGGLSHLQGDRIDSFAPQPAGGSNIVTALAQTGDQELLLAVHGARLLFFRQGHFVPVAGLLLSADASSLLADGSGFVWIRQPHDLSRVSLAALHECTQTAAAPCAARLDHFSTADGLPNDAAAAEGSPQLSMGPAGTLWIATRKGLALTDPAHLPVNTVPPPVVIQRFAVDGVELPINAAGMTIGSGHGRYTFSFAALSYTLPAKVRYRYKLEGLDRDWIDSGTARVAYYTSLPARRYRFEVQAQNNDGVWDRTNAVVAFRVLPPFYRRWWFAVLLVLLGVGLFLLMLRLRERVVQRRFALVLQERNRMAREIHDTLAQDFVSVSLQLDIASSLLRAQQPEQALSQLQSTRNLVREGLQAARQSIWNLRATAGEDSLPTRLSALVARYTFAGKPPSVSIGGAFRKLSATLEAEVLRIAQESLSNAERHAEASEVRVALSYKTDQLQLTVRDNGKGFSEAEAQALEGHYGLRGMRERAGTLRGELMITSNPAEGTTVSLVVPLRKES